MQLQRLNTSRNGGELTSHTSPFCNDYNKLQSFAFLVFVFLFPTRQKLRFHLSYSHTSSLVFDVREPLCVQYENAWTVLRKPPRRRSGITRARYLSMRVPPVFPVGAARRRPYRASDLTYSTSDCAMLLRSRRTKRSGIIREMALVMSRPSVVPRYAVTVGSLARGNGDRENT